MRELLDRSSQRCIAILDILLDQEGWITIPELSKRIGAGARTLSNDLNLIKEKWGKQLGLEVSPKLGFRTNHQNTAIVGKVLIEIFTHSIPLQCLEEIFFYPRKEIEFFEGKLFTSQSTLNRLFLKINHYIERTEMKILRKNNQYEIVGKNETNLRQIFAGFLLELHGLDLKKWEIKIDLDLIRDIIQNILKKKLEQDDVSFILKDDLVLVYFLMYYLVSLIRENQGYHDSAYDHKDDYHLLKKQELESLKKDFPNINASSIQPIHGFILNQYLGWDHEEEQKMVEKEADYFFKNLFCDKKIMTEDKQLKYLKFSLKSIYLTQKTRPFLNSALFDRTYYFTKTIQKHNYPLYHAIQTNLKVFSEKTGMDMSSKLSACIYWICLIFPEINYNTGAIKILVISDLGINHAQFMARYLKNYFKNDYNDLTFHIEAYPKILESHFFDDYHIIVTTVLNLPIKHDNIVLINDYPTEANMFELYKASRKILNKDINDHKNTPD